MRTKPANPNSSRRRRDFSTCHSFCSMENTQGLPDVGPTSIA